MASWDRKIIEGILHCWWIYAHLASFHIGCVLAIVVVMFSSFCCSKLIIGSLITHWRQELHWRIAIMDFIWEQCHASLNISSAHYCCCAQYLHWSQRELDHTLKVCTCTEENEYLLALMTCSSANLHWVSNHYMLVLCCAL